MNSYDVIVVGAGNGGLVAAKTLKNAGYKVLLLDEHNQVGGMSRNINKGRFEFVPSFHCLFSKDNNSFNVCKLFKDIGINESIEFKDIDSDFRIISKESGSIYNLPFGIDNFIKRVEEYVEGSKDSVVKFFELAEECYDALEYLSNNKDSYSLEYLEENYENFVSIGNVSLSRVLDSIKMPLKAQEIINSWWVCLGSSETELSFVHYASLIYCLVKGVKVPSNGSYEIALAILNSYLEQGGEVRYNSKVVNLIIEGNKCKGVKLLDGSSYYAKYIIVNSDIKTVYECLVEEKDLPIKAIRNINSREIGPRVFTVLLGLNRSREELKLDSDCYLIYDCLDSDAVLNRMKNIENSNVIACNYNNVKAAGTCVVSLSTLFVDDCFNNSIDGDNYGSVVNNVVTNLIDSFEQSTHIMIKDFIEEIEVLNPLFAANYTSGKIGSCYGFKLVGLDNIVPRLLNNCDECYVEGLFDCGGFDGDLFKEMSSFKSGYDAALRVIKDRDGDLGE